MAFCSNCGTKLAENANFCSSCGFAAAGSSVKPNPETVNNKQCPSCGARVSAMAAVCSSCGNEFFNTVNLTVKDFFNRFDVISQEVFEVESAMEAKGPIGGAVGAMLGIDALVKTYRGTSAGVKRKINMILNYPIPNNKEDIIEFILLASSRYRGVKKPFGNGMMVGVNEKMEEYKLDEAWKAKCEQAYAKARISFGSDRTAMNEIEKILKSKKVI